MILAPESPGRNRNDWPERIPPHVREKWRRFNLIVDEALAADLHPWPLAEIACSSIAKEWAL